MSIRYKRTRNTNLNFKITLEWRYNIYFLIWDGGELSIQSLLPKSKPSAALFLITHLDPCGHFLSYLPTPGTLFWFFSTLLEVALLNYHGSPLCKAVQWQPTVARIQTHYLANMQGLSRPDLTYFTSPITHQCVTHSSCLISQPHSSSTPLSLQCPVFMKFPFPTALSSRFSLGTNFPRKTPSTWLWIWFPS